METLVILAVLLLIAGGGCFIGHLFNQIPRDLFDPLPDE